MSDRSYDSYFIFPDQDVIHSQEQSIIELLKAVSAQSDQINHQRTKIKILEEKVGFRNCT